MHLRHIHCITSVTHTYVYMYIDRYTCTSRLLLVGSLGTLDLSPRPLWDLRSGAQGLTRARGSLGGATGRRDVNDWLSRWSGQRSIYLSILLQICTHTYMHIYIYVCLYIYVCIHNIVHMYMCIYIYTCVHFYVSM